LLCKIREAFNNAIGVGVEIFGNPFLAFGVLLVPRNGNGFEGFGISWRTADVFGRAPPGSFQ
jgi:hypothetical protein